MSDLSRLGRHDIEEALASLGQSGREEVAAAALEFREALNRLCLERTLATAREEAPPISEPAAQDSLPRGHLEVSLVRAALAVYGSAQAPAESVVGPVEALLLAPTATILELTTILTAPKEIGCLVETLGEGPELLKPMLQLEEDGARLTFESKFGAAYNTGLADLLPAIPNSEDENVAEEDFSLEAVGAFVRPVHGFLSARPELLPEETTDGAVDWYNRALRACADVLVGLSVTTWDVVEERLERDASRHLVPASTGWTVDERPSTLVCQIASDVEAGVVVARLSGLSALSLDGEEEVVVPECIVISGGPRQGLFYDIRRELVRGIRSKDADTDSPTGDDDQMLLGEVGTVQAAYESALYTRNRDRFALQLVNLVDKEAARRARFAEMLEGVLAKLSAQLDLEAVELAKGQVFEDSLHARFDAVDGRQRGIVERSIRRCFVAKGDGGIVQKGLVELEQ